MPIILLVGEDEILQRTRAAVLRTTGAATVTSNAASALTVLSNRSCDLLVLCHSLPEPIATGLVAAARSRWPNTPILQMTSLRIWESFPHEGIVEAVPSADPGRLVRRSLELLRAAANRSASPGLPMN